MFATTMITKLSYMIIVNSHGLRFININIEIAPMNDIQNPIFEIIQIFPNWVNSRNKRHVQLFCRFTDLPHSMEHVSNICKLTLFVRANFKQNPSIGLYYRRWKKEKLNVHRDTRHILNKKEEIKKNRSHSNKNWNIQPRSTI